MRDGADRAVDVRTAQLATYACRVLALLDDRAPAEDFDLAASDARTGGTAPEDADRARRLGLSVRAALDRSERREACLVALVDTGRELALQEDLGPYDPELAAAGQSVVLAHVRGLAQPVAVAWRRTLEFQDPAAPEVREFVEAWLGTGAPR